MNVERIPKAIRLAVPNSLTMARPVLGYFGLREARKGNWKKAGILFAGAMVTDLEGNVGRFLHATSSAGAVADPVADGILRAETLVAIAPHMNPIVAGATGLVEVENLRLNKDVQKGKKKPDVPPGAKWGSVVEAAGAIAFLEGIKKEDKFSKFVGQLTILAGALVRNASYQTLYNRQTNSTLSR